MLKKIVVLSMACLVILFDQLTKVWALSHLDYMVSKPLFSFFSWTLVFNSGSAFSFLAHSGPWHHWFLMAFSAIVAVILFAWIMKLNSNKAYDFYQMFSLAFILGGAIGNLIDRIKVGMVVDFIDLHYHQLHWPVFNVADMAICIGGAGLLWIWTSHKQ